MLKSPEAVLMRHLLATPNAARLVGRRVYAMIAPTSATYPFISYRRTSIQREQAMQNPVGVPRVSVDFEVYAGSYEQARETADAVRAALDGYGGSALGCTVSQTSLESEADDFVTLQEGGLPPAYQITQTYDVWWQES
jgi:hypothetical protein